MKIYFISPIGKKSDLLFDTMIQTFESNGHVIADNIGEANVVFFDMYDRNAKYDYDVLYSTSYEPRIIFDFWDYGGCEDGTHVFPYVPDVYGCFLDFSIGDDIWFVRKLDKTQKQYNKVYPIECIMYPDHDFTPVSKEELFNRPYDICFIGNTSPTRKNVVKDRKSVV